MVLTCTHALSGELSNVLEVPCAQDIVSKVRRAVGVGMQEYRKDRGREPPRLTVRQDPPGVSRVFRKVDGERAP
jgi:hypothetical protein